MTGMMHNQYLFMLKCRSSFILDMKYFDKNLRNTRHSGVHAGI
jgi:hypothetical protein